MTRAEVNEFLKSGVNALRPSVEYGRGRIFEFNSIRNHNYPAAWWLTGEDSAVNTELSDNSTPIDNWNIKIRIAQIHKADATAEEYEGIVDECDRIAQRLRYKYDQIVSGYKLVTITGVERVPFVKDQADCLSGVDFSFNLVAVDTTNNCE